MCGHFHRDGVSRLGGVEYLRNVGLQSRGELEIVLFCFGFASG